MAPVVIAFNGDSEKKRKFFAIPIVIKKAFEKLHIL